MTKVRWVERAAQNGFALSLTMAAAFSMVEHSIDKLVTLIKKGCAEGLFPKTSYIDDIARHKVERLRFA